MLETKEIYTTIYNSLILSEDNNFNTYLDLLPLRDK